MLMDYYFIKRTDSDFIGQYTADEIRAKMASGEFEPNFQATPTRGLSYSHFNKAGFSDWVSLVDLLSATTPPPPPSVSPPPIVTPPSPAEAKQSKSSATKGCLGCLGVIVGIILLLGIMGSLFGPSDSGKNDSDKAQDRQPDPALAGELQAWLSSGPWKCVDAASKGGEGFPGIMKGATFQFTASQLRISGGGAEATHTYRIESVSKSVNAGADLFASLRIGSSEESLLKLKPEGGFDFAGMSWGDGAWTLKLARSQR